MQLRRPLARRLRSMMPTSCCSNDASPFVWGSGAFCLLEQRRTSFHRLDEGTGHGNP